MGPYFAQSVAEKKILLKDRLKALLLNRDIELYTTRCCINELQFAIDKKNQKKFAQGFSIFFLSFCQNFFSIAILFFYFIYFFVLRSETCT